MSATTTSPARARPGSSRCPYLRRPKVTVSAASNDPPRTSPVSPWTPLGTSTATQTRSRAAHASASASGSPSSGRASPAPNSASTTSGSPSSSAGQSGSTGPSHRSAIAAASPLRRSRRTQQPEPHRPAGLRQQPRGYEAVTAVVAGAAENGDRPGRPAPHDGLRHRAAGVLHQREPRRARARRRRVGRIHLGNGEERESADVAHSGSVWSRSTRIGCTKA